MSELDDHLGSAAGYLIDHLAAAEGLAAEENSRLMAARASSAASAAADAPVTDGRVRQDTTAAPDVQSADKSRPSGHQTSDVTANPTVPSPLSTWLSILSGSPLPSADGRRRQ